VLIIERLIKVAISGAESLISVQEIYLPSDRLVPAALDEGGNRLRGLGLDPSPSLSGQLPGARIPDPGQGGSWRSPRSYASSTSNATNESATTERPTIKNAQSSASELLCIDRDEESPIKCDAKSVAIAAQHDTVENLFKTLVAKLRARYAHRWRGTNWHN
jgi:hypothetical protein